MNDKIKFELIDGIDFMLLEFELKQNLLAEDLKTLDLPDPVKLKFSNRLFVISGRGPIWLYCYLNHFYHVCRAIAVFDPRFQAAVVVQTHDDSYEVGDLVKIDSSQLHMGK